MELLKQTTGMSHFTDTFFLTFDAQHENLNFTRTKSIYMVDINVKNYEFFFFNKLNLTYFHRNFWSVWNCKIVQNALRKC